MKGLRLILLILILVLLPLPFVERSLRVQQPQALGAPLLRYPDEQRAFVKGLHFDARGEYLEPGDYAGAAYSAHGGIRTTTGQPTTDANTLYLLGPSTVLDVWNPDTDTIASQLQRLIHHYHVVNLGIQGGSTGAQYARLMTVALRPGDVVVLYTGDAEARAIANQEQGRVQRLYSASPCGWALDQVPFIALVQATCAWWNNPTPSDADLTARITAALPAYLGWIDRIQAAATHAGASFALVLAPALTARPLSAYESALAAPYALSVQNERLAYPLFERALAGRALDLTHALDAYREGHDIYYDPWHVTGDANALIARAIYDYLVRVF